MHEPTRIIAGILGLFGLVLIPANPLLTYFRYRRDKIRHADARRYWLTHGIAMEVFAVGTAIYGIYALTIDGTIHFLSLSVACLIQVVWFRFYRHFIRMQGVRD